MGLFSIVLKERSHELESCEGDFFFLCPLTSNYHFILAPCFDLFLCVYTTCSEMICLTVVKKNSENLRTVIYLQPKCWRSKCVKLVCSELQMNLEQGIAVELTLFLSMTSV